MITEFLDLIHKVLTYDPVILSIIAFSIIYKLFEWEYLSSSKKKTDLESEKESTCIVRKNKEPSSHRNHPLHLQDVQTNTASYSQMKGSFKKGIQGRATSSQNVPKITEDTSTSKSTTLDVKTDEMTSSKHFGTKSLTYMLIGADEMKIRDEPQNSALQECKQLFSPPSLTKSRETMNMPELEHQGHHISSLKWSVIDVSKIKMHLLRKLLENLMKAFPKIVQRSVQMYNESIQIPPRQRGFIVCSGHSMDSNELDITTRFKSNILVSDVRPLNLNLDASFLIVNDKIQRSMKTTPTMGCSLNNIVTKVPSPIGHKGHYRKLPSRINFKRSKRPSKKDTDLPTGNFLYLGMKIEQVLSPDICINKSPKQMKNSETPKYKSHFLEPGIMEGAEVTRSKLQTTKANNKLEVTEKYENYGIIIPNPWRPPHVTSQVYSIPLQKPNLEDGKNIPTMMVREVTYSCSDGKTSAPLFHCTDPSNTSRSRLLEVFRSFKNIFLKTEEPSHPPRRLRRSRSTNGKSHYRNIF